MAIGTKRMMIAVTSAGVFWLSKRFASSRVSRSQSSLIPEEPLLVRSRCNWPHCSLFCPTAASSGIRRQASLERFEFLQPEIRPPSAFNHHRLKIVHECSHNLV